MKEFVTKNWKTIVIVAIVLIAIWYFFLRKKKHGIHELYIEYIDDTGKPRVCYDAPNGTNCLTVTLGTNQYTTSGDIGIYGFSYKADLNAERNSVKITLYDQAKKEIDVITASYK